MTDLTKNRNTVTFRQNDESNETYRPDAELFYTLQKELEPYRVQYARAKKLKGKFIIVLKQEDIKMGTYKVSAQRFTKLKEKLQPYRSLPAQSKKVRCAETGQIFKNAKEAARWLKFVLEREYCNFDLIKQCCRGVQKSSYGYHWEFVTE